MIAATHPENDAPEFSARATTRRAVYLVLIAASAGSLAARIAAVNSVDRIGLEAHLRKDHNQPTRNIQRPFLSANDRSRWCTMRALVEHGTYEIDQVIGLREQDRAWLETSPDRDRQVLDWGEWDTIDKVKHDGQGQAAPKFDEGHYYSSKPPLLATMMAGPYWVVHRLTGETLGTKPYEIGRGLLLLFNLLPWVVYLAVLARLCERFGGSDWGRVFVFGCGAFGTLLPTFGSVLTNHLPAAVSAIIGFDAALRVAYDGERRARWFAISGFFAALAAANELPALALFAATSCGLFVIAPRQAILAYLPASLLVAAAFFGTNYLSHHSLLPAYANRNQGNNWYDYEVKAKDGTIKKSYFVDPPKGSIDAGEADPATYALHALVGHHGIFSLTSMWLLAVVGLLMLCAGRQSQFRAAGCGVLAVTGACIAFYLLRPTVDRNYGGNSCGFRWALWFAPLWLWAMLPAADWFGKRTATRVFAALLLAASAFSASYPTWSPWTPPWLMTLLEQFR